MQSASQYLAIDLKSFYASVECVERGLDPLTTNLVVADEGRTDKTICLAVSPSLKRYGTGGRPRLFEVRQKVPKDVDYIVAAPRMALYLEYSNRIYQVYLKYIAPEDIHVYSVDEVFMDVTSYLATYRMTAHELAITIIRDVQRQTGITATAGIGTNMYLAKVAMDIVAKHIPADDDGVRIAELDEESYRRKLWSHTPITDFWRVGCGIAQRLAPYGIRTMGDIARLSLRGEEFLYKMFGVNAELLIDHAWGWEPCTIDLVKAYRPETHSLSSGQVLTEPYTAQKARVVVKEMAEAMALSLLDKRLVANQLVLTVGYDVENLARPDIASRYHGAIHVDHYGRSVPKAAHGTSRFEQPTSSARVLNDAVTALYDRIINPGLLVRRLNLTAGQVEREGRVEHEATQLNLFTDYEEVVRQQKSLAKERKLMETTLALKKRFGKNSVLKGLNFCDGATARERNGQIGGHKA